ncbi:Oxidase FUB9 [Colletotrichum orbiculare MAFF 240422]|uniref:Oxidase FUB9 n=1 Tax=Colletotrichum orbiculare (strain 104-T / ATCC 96160 / CBS 514.97 / LARS 414 / MAFF 240422) TaxID=1213857 RepID=A0A484FE49_COLOR|nr:Oxidase FUB9 [Colletotrichum orbiculare MAFF 240422]
MSHYMSIELVLSVADIQIAASKSLSSSAREFYDAGSTTQVTVKDNSPAYSKYWLLPRVLVDVSTRDTRISLFGQKIGFPLCVSPAGTQAMAHLDGELATSTACVTRNMHIGVSSSSNQSIEEVRAAGMAAGSTQQHVMQLYMMKDRDAQLHITRRAEEAGCAAVSLTADSPVLGARCNEPRNQFRIPEGLSLPMLERTSEAIQAQTHEDVFATINSKSHSWAEEIPWLRSVTKMQVRIKGVLTPEDVELAIQYQCDGVIFSNYGGRQLDETPATIDVLQDCAKAAEGRIRVHIDGGIRTGTDISKHCILGRSASGWEGLLSGDLLIMKRREYRRC